MAAPGYPIDPSEYPQHTDPAKLWPQDMPMLSEKEVSRCRGIIELIKVRKQINALRSTVVGIYSVLLTNSPESTGIALTAVAASTYASFASLRKNLEDSITTVDPAGKLLRRCEQMMRENTSSSGETR